MFQLFLLNIEQFVQIADINSNKPFSIRQTQRKFQQGKLMEYNSINKSW